MMEAPFTGSLQSNGWHFYSKPICRRQEVYTLPWNLLDLTAYIVAGARRGGPLGTTYTVA